MTPNKADALAKDEFPDCMFCAPCRCDDECGCAGGVCWACGHWYDKATKKVFIVTERGESTPSVLKEVESKVKDYFTNRIEDYERMAAAETPKNRETIETWLNEAEHNKRGILEIIHKSSTREAKEDEGGLAGKLNRHPDSAKSSTREDEDVAMLPSVFFTDDGTREDGVKA